MTPPGALAVTALVLAVVAGVIGLSTDSKYIGGYERRRRARMAWTLFVLAALTVAGAAWWKALA